MDKSQKASPPSSPDSPAPDPKPTLPLSQPRPNTPPTSLDDPNKQAIGFAKAAFAFHDSLEKSRRKHEAAQHDSPPESPRAETTKAVHEAKYARKIRILRVIQHTVTSILSLTIAVLQGRTYAIYQQTKNVPNAWPTHPSLAPTLLLFGIAITALIFDCCALLAYIFPGTNLARRAYSIALNTHNVVASGKSVSWAIVAIVCRSGFQEGNASGENNDLWSWSCSAKAGAQKEYNQADYNCVADTVAWIMSMAQLFIEILGVIINVLLKNQGDTSKAGQDTGDEDPDSEKKALIPENQLDEWGEELNGDLESASPDLKGDPPKN